MAPGDEQKPSYLLTAARNHLMVIAAFVLVGVTLGLLYLSTQPPIHNSAARVLINPVGGNPFSPSVSPSQADQLSSLETEAQVARSDAVLQDVSPPDLPVNTDSLRVTVLPNTQIIEIGYSTSNPQLARDTAQAVAEAYLENRRARWQDIVNAELTRVERRTERVISDLRTATALAQQGSPERRAFQTELANSLNNELVNLRDQRTTLESSTVAPGEIITPAAVEAGAGQVRELLPPLAGGLVGLALGMGAAALIERRGGRIRSMYDVRAAGLDVLGAGPPGKRSLQRRGHSGRSSFPESIRWLRAAVLETDPPSRSVAVSSSSSSASSAVADALAASLAKLGHRVVLVDADPSTQHRPGTGDGEVGFAEILAGAPHHSTRARRTSSDNDVSVIGHGLASGDSRDYYVPERVAAALVAVAPEGGHVVMKAPVVISPEGEAVAKAVDLAVILVIIGVTRKAEVSAIAATVASSDRAFAMLINKSEMKHNPGAGGGHGHRRGTSNTSSRQGGRGQTGADPATVPLSAR